MILKDYHAAIDFIESFSNISLRKNFGKKKKDPSFFLKRTAYFLDLLGNPEKDFSFVHVTGTAGKGTVSTMLQEVLMASGKETGLFTSPYVTTSIEKIKVSDKFISPAELIELIGFLKPLMKKAEKGPYGHSSAFEIFLVIALLYFKRKKCTWVVLEVGVGGRYDATNIIKNPVVTAITNIGLDHTEILGNTLGEIAADKAGIIKRGSKFFTSERRPKLREFFRKVSLEVGADFTALPRGIIPSEDNKELVRTIGRALTISENDIEKGISAAKMSCRFEVMQTEPTVILDGAHNILKIKNTISRLSQHSFKKLYIILSIADTKKDHSAILEPLLSMPYSMHIVLTQVKTFERRTISPKLLLETAEKYIRKLKRKGLKIEIIEEAHDALNHVLALAKKADLVLVTGSFFLAGELRKKWFSEEYILKNKRCT